MLAVDTFLGPTTPSEVVSTVEIDAPPEVVWEHVIGFDELPEPRRFLFRTGVAYPTKAHLEGEGVDAVRYCEFSTGSFVEPITVWDPPRRLAFDVAAQPPPMTEWSFHGEVDAPHLEGFLHCLRGEFRLVPLPGGIHAIHLRVLEHIRDRAEDGAR